MTTSTRARTAAIAALLAAILMAAGALLVVRTTSGDADPAAVATEDRAERAEGVDDDGADADLAGGAQSAADAPDEDALDALDDSFGFDDSPGDAPDAEAGAGSGGPLDPAGSAGEPLDQCVGVLAAGDALLVTPDPAVLESGDLSDHLTITNCSDAPVDWTAQTIPSVALAHTSGNLLPGSSTLLGFTIDGSAYEPGAIDFKIKVMEPGANHYVDISAFREMVGSDMVADVGFTAGDQAGGCANQCITSALLSSVYNSPDVNLEVRTNVPAQMTVWVSTQAPLDVGFPLFMGVPPAGQSLVLRTAWTTGIDGLAADTTYHIVVRAVDANGNRSYRQGTFHTTTPVPQVGDLLDVGDGAACWVQCITEATVAPDSLDADLHVETHTSAMLDAWVSVDAPAEGPGGIPVLPGAPLAATTDGLDVTTWDATIGGLQPDTTYHIVVRATDLFGGRSYQAGTFHTDAGDRYLVRFEQINVQGDGDDGGANRGELSFQWGFDQFRLGGRGEDKIPSDTSINLGDDHTAFVAVDDGGVLPDLVVNAAERDADGQIEFCALSQGLFSEPGYYPECDAKINVATSDPISFASLDDRLRCSHYGIDDVADSACVMFQSVLGLGGDYATFWVVVSITPID